MDSCVLHRHVYTVLPVICIVSFNKAALSQTLVCQMPEAGLSLCCPAHDQTAMCTVSMLQTGCDVIPLQGQTEQQAGINILSSCALAILHCCPKRYHC